MMMMMMSLLLCSLYNAIVVVVDIYLLIIFCDILEELSKMLEDFGNSKTSQVEVM